MKKILLFIGLCMLFAVVANAQDVSISPQNVAKRIKVGDFLEQKITLTNNEDRSLAVTFSIEGDISKFITLNSQSLVLEPSSTEIFSFTFFGENKSAFAGDLVMRGDINQRIALNITVSDTGSLPVEALLIEIEPISDKAKIGDIFKFKVGIQNLLQGQNFNITLAYSIDRLEKDDETYTFDKSFFEESEVVELDTSLSLVKEFEMPEFIRPGTYIINVKASYEGLDTSASRTFRVVEPFYDHVILGILPVRWVIFFAFFILVSGIGGFIYYKKKASKKRYVVKIDYDLLPKPGPRSAYIGMIAESKKKAYFDLEALTTHTLIAGSTGGGKTVSAEVLVEEALLKGVSVIVFDPTAQWTGFLRKNTDKKMFTLYPLFGMKKTDSRAFNGNIRQILNARERIDIKKYMKAGEINVFSINRLDPEDADVLVSNTIREVFHANLSESRELRLLIIFDEVHRLLPKFGGSGQGFIQIERGCREFRKWGTGLFLISQVLTDFVGETKANINTEIQMRTRDQGDLDRIKNKYGGYMLQSLLKSATGTGMLENANYNKGNPYFVAFRPLMHEHARLPDKELENYNKYNDMIDELEYQIDQLEKMSIDVFDLRLELKMALDKVKQGSFNMVDIYLEGLKPRLTDQWKKLGKEPEKKKATLVSESELREEFIKAQEARKKFESEHKVPGGAISTQKGIFKFKDGNVVTNLGELVDVLKVLDENIFKEHVNETKNEIAEWMKTLKPKVGDALSKVKTKGEMIKVLEKEEAPPVA